MPPSLFPMAAAYKRNSDDPHISGGQVLPLKRDIPASELVFIDDGFHFLLMNFAAAVAAHINCFLGMGDKLISFPIREMLC